MHQLYRIILLLIGLLNMPAGLAADTDENDSGAFDSLFSIDNRLFLTGGAQQATVPTFGATHDSSIEFKFHDSSALGRIRNLRSLSFLTLAETERLRLFLGVNRRGLFGFHFGNRSPNASDRSLELARMPYLKGTAPEKPARE
jgi:hypothetical protein